MPTIYLTHSPRAFELYYGEAALAELSRLGRIKRNPSEREPDEDMLVEQAQDADFIVSFRIPSIPASVLDCLPRTKAICRVAVDVRNIDVEAASRNGILVTRASPGFAASVSEWIIGAMIDLNRGISAAVGVYREGAIPTPHMGGELRNAVLGVIGYGTIGRYLARLALAFGMRVKVCDPHVDIADDAIEQTSLEELLALSDHVVCLAPATPETAGLMNREAFARMRPSAFFINASRGELVDEQALLDALDTGRIAGSALDVGMGEDQTPALALASHPLVIATPHIGGLTPAAAHHQAMDTVAQIRAMTAGEIPRGALNAGQAYRLYSLCSGSTA